MPDTDHEALVVTRQLRKEYTTGTVVTPVLQDINLTIARGEFVAIMGPSGSGKSTLMNILGCLDNQTAGEYWLDGADVQTLTADQTAELRNRTLGFVFQGFNLLPRRNAIHNVAMPMICAGKHQNEWEPRAKELLKQVGLSSRMQAMPNEMSGGQQQRVAIARALSNHPQIILADEPTGNLDSTTSIEIMHLFTQLNEEGITVILVTHEPDIAMYTKRLVKCRDGHIVYDGPVTEAGLAA